MHISQKHDDYNIKLTIKKSRVFLRIEEIYFCKIFTFFGIQEALDHLASLRQVEKQFHN